LRVLLVGEIEGKCFPMRRRTACRIDDVRRWTGDDIRGGSRGQSRGALPSEISGPPVAPKKFKIGRQLPDFLLKL